MKDTVCHMFITPNSHILMHFEYFLLFIGFTVCYDISYQNLQSRFQYIKYFIQNPPNCLSGIGVFLG